MDAAKRDAITSALKLQGDLKFKFIEMGFGRIADTLACDIMDMVLKSDAVKPEIKKIYEEIADGIV